jgi:hypothetical protein
MALDSVNLAPGSANAVLLQVGPAARTLTLALALALALTSVRTLTLALTQVPTQPCPQPLQP